MPKLWNDTIETHRRAVRDATLDATAALVEKRGLRSVTMSEVAEATGIGRATLYKYFPDVESILVAWHERHIGAHLEQLAALRHRSGSTSERLEGMLEFYAFTVHEHHGTELAALLHRGRHVAHAQEHLIELIQGVLTEGAKARVFRDDVPPRELASYCLHALGAASKLTSKAAVRRLVRVVLAGLLR